MIRRHLIPVCTSVFRIFVSSFSSSHFVFFSSFFSFFFFCFFDMSTSTDKKKRRVAGSQSTSTAKKAGTKPTTRSGGAPSASTQATGKSKPKSNAHASSKTTPITDDFKRAYADGAVPAESSREDQSTAFPLSQSMSSNSLSRGLCYLVNATETHYFRKCLALHVFQCCL